VLLGASKRTDLWIGCNAGLVRDITLAMEDAEARFRAVFESTYPTVARYVRHRGVGGADADDVVAGTYEVAWRRLDRVPPGDEALPWLLAVARNLLRNHRRRLLRERGLTERLGAPRRVGVEPSILSWRDIRRALDLLSDEDRELVLLVAWDGLAPAHAAGVLDLTPAAARTRLHRARARIAQELGIERGSQRSAAFGHKH
jgi:RNA polymerase sigma factor (sigma-70 family)